MKRRCPNLRKAAVCKVWKPRILAIWCGMDRGGNDRLPTHDAACAELYRQGIIVSRETLKKWRGQAANLAATAAKL